MQKNTTDKKSFFANFMTHGGAGILAVLAIFLIFILCVTLLKSLTIGALLAFLLLPLEKFYERKFFHAKGKEKNLSLEEREKKRRYRILGASTLTFITLLISVFLIVSILFSVAVPYAVKMGKQFAEWNRNDKKIEYLESKIASTVEEIGGKELRNFAQDKIAQYAGNYEEELANYAISGGKNLIMILVSTLKKAGTMAFNLLLSLFFFFFFLQKMALFECPDKTSKENSGHQAAGWFVKSIFSSTWMPNVSEETQQTAIRILSHISDMLGKWGRGYLTIIIVEVIAYSIAMTLAGVPYPILAGTVAGMTILLPILGIIASIVLTVLLCLIFCETNLVATLVAVALIYLVICLFEELFLYPKCVGNALGLTMLETIIVVLLGGMCFGVVGMVLAVPTASIIKYIVPFFYSAALSGQEKKEDKNV